MDEVFREAVIPYEDAAAGVPGPWSVPDGAWRGERFCALREDGNRCEVIGGRLVTSPPPETGHQAVSMQLALQLGHWAKRTEAGKVFAAPLAVIFPNPASCLGPDPIFVAREHRSIITPDHVQGPPDWVVEILSPGSVQADGRAATNRRGGTPARHPPRRRASRTYRGIRPRCGTDGKPTSSAGRCWMMEHAVRIRIVGGWAQLMWEPPCGSEEGGGARRRIALTRDPCRVMMYMG